MTIDDGARLRLLQSAIYGEAIGDALGVPFEGKARDTFACAAMTSDPDYAIPPGTYSDDTAMTLATLDSLMHTDGRVDPDDLRERYRDWLFDGKYTVDGMAFGVGRTTSRALGADRGMDGERDNGNGSLMRAVPLAFFDVDDDGVRAMSAVTHAHETSMEACVRYVRAARALVDGASTRRAAALAGLDGVWLDAREDVPSSGYVLDTLRAALWCLTTTDSYRDCVLEAVNLGDDADTTAAVAGALAGIVYGFDDEREERDGRGIPGEWDDALRGGRIITEVLCGGPLDVEDWDLPEDDGAELLTAHVARERGDARSRDALLQSDPQERERLFIEAARWFAAGVQLEDAQCAVNLGVLYLYGHLPAQDAYGAAMSCFRQGERLGSAESACYLGDMLRDGRGCEPDAEAAVERYAHAYDLARDHLDADDPHEQPVIAMIHLRLGWCDELRLERADRDDARTRRRLRASARRHYREALGLARRAVESGLRMYVKEIRLARAGLERVEAA